MICKQGISLIGLIIAAPWFAQTSDESWHRNSELQKALAAQLEIHSSSESLRSFVLRLSQSQRVAVFLDRRLDPTTPRDFTLHGRSLKSILYLAAAQSGGGASLFADAIYIGPGDVVAVLPEALTTLRTRVKSLPPESRKVWQRAEAWQMARLSRPADLVKQLAADHELNAMGIEKIPHDLWPEVDLPPLSLAEKFACILLGFGLWPEISADGKAVRITEFVVPETITRTHSSQPLGEFTSWLRENFPNAQVKKKSSSLVITAPPADHHQIALWLAEHETPKKAASPAAKKVVTLNATATAGNIATQVAAQLGVELVCDPKLQKQLETRVEIHVEQVTYPELLSKVFADTGLSFQLDDRQLRIFAK